MKTLSILLAVLLLSTATFAQWTKSNGVNNRTVTVLGNNESTMFAGTENDGLYRSDDYGMTWNQAGLQNLEITSIITKDSTLVIGTAGCGLFISKNNGREWTDIGRNTPTPAVAFSIKDSTLFVSTIGSGLYRSTDSGLHWSNVFVNNYVKTIAVVDSFVYIGTQADGLFRSVDNGNTWESVNDGLFSPEINTINVVNGLLFVGTSNGLYVSVTGDSWLMTSLEYTPVDFLGIYITSVTSCESKIYVGTYEGGMFVSDDNGYSWNKVNNGLPVSKINTVFTMKPFVFTSVAGEGSIYRLSMYESVTSVSKVELPTNYSLSQNYPNPFNPSTTITYTVKTKSPVTLTVFDNLGRIVSTLVNEVKDAGEYSISFNGSQMSSGVYYYVMNTKGFTQTKRMMLVK